MTDIPSTSKTGALETGLRGLRAVTAPPTLLPSILTRVGLMDSYFPIETAIGSVFVAYNAHGVSAVMPAEDQVTFAQAFQERFGRTVSLATEPPASLQRAVMNELQGKRHDLRFDLRGLSEFEHAVLRKALEIPRGEVRPYAWVAREIGRPLAVRAVGSALSHNPVPLLIPCHRVVQSSGKVGQYALGLERKRILLETEGLNPVELELQARQGVRYVGSETTKIYCFPTCRNARRIASRRRRPFHSGEEAVAAGFRPCKVCRPAPIAATA